MVPPCVAFGASPYRGRQQRPGRAGSALSAFWRWPALIVFFLLLLTLTTTVCLAQDSSSATRPAPARGMQPVIEKARAGACVADPAFMRRNHMKLLQHQRDDTLRAGVRDAKYSLKACVECHASRSTNSVTAASSNFCQSCHEYAAVTIDCFECHAHKPGASAAPAASAQVKP